MDIDLRELPAFSNIPEGGLDLIPFKVYRAFFGYELPGVDIRVGHDGTVDSGPDWEAVTEGDKIVGFNRRSASVTADT